MKVTVFGHPFSPIGMGEQLASFSDALSACYFEHNIFDVYSSVSSLQNRDRSWLQSKLTNNVNDCDVRIFHINGDEVGDVLNELKNYNFEMDAAYNIIMPAWELEKYPTAWQEGINLFDEVWAISTFVKKWLEEEAVVATYKENDPTAIIQRFRHSESKWIISVGMISEGTNIPRLQVCCYLSNIKTEMYFRQTLGRILRVTDTTNQEAILYMPAEPKLLEYAYRVRHDVPVEADVVKFETMQSLLVGDETNSQNKTISLKGPSIDLSGNEIKLNDFNENIDSLFDEDFLSTSYDQVMNIFGRFKQETIGLGLGLGELK